MSSDLRWVRVDRTNEGIEKAFELRQGKRAVATVFIREDSFWQFRLAGGWPSTMYTSAAQAKAQARKLFLARSTTL